MRSLHFAACFLIGAGSGVVFLLDLAIGSSTRASDIPQWTQTCTISPVKDYAELACPNKYKQAIAVSAAILPALKQSAVKCSAYPTRGLARDLDVACGAP